MRHLGILASAERTLSDALHKHNAEMRAIYPLCGRAGISTQEADKFMAMLFFCHDFYKDLSDIYINAATLARFGAPAARRLWDTIKNEGLKQGGIGKIKSSLETETERLNREVKEAIANGTAKVVAKKLDGNYKIKDDYLTVDEGILMLERIAGAPMVWESLISDAGKRKKVLELRKELKQPIEFRQMDRKVPVPLEPELYKSKLVAFELEAKLQDMEENVKESSDSSNFRWLVDVKKGVKPINSLNEVFRKMLINDFLEFKINHPKYEQTIVLSETTRTIEDQATILLKFWHNNKLVSTYGKTGEKNFIYFFMKEVKNINFANQVKDISEEDLVKKYNIPLKRANLILPFAHNPTDEEALKIFRAFASSDHMSRKAVDVSGSSNDPELKRDLMYFLHRKRTYTIFLYKDDGQNPYITSRNGRFYFYGTETEITSDSFVFRAMEKYGNIHGWFFHIQEL